LERNENCHNAVMVLYALHPPASPQMELHILIARKRHFLVVSRLNFKDDTVDSFIKFKLILRSTAEWQIVMAIFEKRWAYK
jgi:hypothetical protein